MGIKPRQSPETKTKNICDRADRMWKTGPQHTVVFLQKYRETGKATQRTEELGPSGSRWGSDEIRPLYGEDPGKKPTRIPS